MSFLCPDCGLPDMDVEACLDLPGDARWDAITLQWIHCEACSFVGLAVYRESRRGAPDEEAWDHVGHRLEPAVAVRLRAQMLLCPDPRNRACPCATHRALAARNREGDWIGPEELRSGPTFRMARWV